MEQCTESFYSVQVIQRMRVMGASALNAGPAMSTTSSSQPQPWSEAILKGCELLIMKFSYFFTDFVRKKSTEVIQIYVLHV